MVSVFALCPFNELIGRVTEWLHLEPEFGCSPLQHQPPFLRLDAPDFDAIAFGVGQVGDAAVLMAIYRETPFQFPALSHSYGHYWVRPFPPPSRRVYRLPSIVRPSRLESKAARSWRRASAKVFFGRRPLSSVTRGNLEDYKAWRRTKHQVREVMLRHDLHALSLLFQYGAKHNWCKGNPVEEVDIPSDAAAVRMHVLTPAEEAKYLAAIDALIAEKLARNLKYIADRLKDLRDLAVLMLNQGCRPEELREIEQCSVDLAKGYLRVEKGKSKAARRRLRLTAESRVILAERLKTQGRWVFPGKTPDKHIGAHQRLHDAALEKSGLSFVPYDLRHTCATSWVESGVSIATIAKWLGHANLRTVQKYIHLSDEHLDAQAERVEQEWLEKRWQALQKEKPQSEGSDRVN
jgi:integrase